MTPIKGSSNIAGVLFEPSSKITGKLTVKFKNGDLWEYDKVSAAQHDALMKAESRGKWVVDNLVRKPNTHPAKKVEVKKK